MFKKVLSTAVLSISALGVMAANAAAPGVYISGQLGYADTHMGDKTNIADINSRVFKSLVITPINPRDTDLTNNGLAGRIALGYQFNPNFALEAGYLRLSSSRVTGKAYKGIGGQGTLTLQQNVIDFLAKGIIPISDKFNLYGKAGLAYVNSAISANVPTIPPIQANLNNVANVARYKLAPEVALGVSYDLSSHVSVDTSWTHIQAFGKSRPGNIDFVAVGLSYNFG
jgi:opacity protein-like surface antigen